MAKLHLALIWAAVAWPISAEAQVSSPPESSNTVGAEVGSCQPGGAAEVVVCGRSDQKYRIDPGVLAAARAAEAQSPKPQLDASNDVPCVGPSCGGPPIPLVGMALTALKAGLLAAEGDDWRDAFRTRPDQYKVYEAGRAAKNRVSIGVSASSK